MEDRIYLDPEKLQPFEPYEGDDRNASWISPFHIPREVHFGGDGDRVAGVRFVYPDDEIGGEPTPFDGLTSPAIRARVGRFSGRILGLDFDGPVSLDDFSSIGQRVDGRAETQPRLGLKFHYQMIARIFEHWDEIVGWNRRVGEEGKHGSES